MEEYYPLHLAAMDPGEMWGEDLVVTCSCGAKYNLWENRCPDCSKKNKAAKLEKKQKRLEKLLTRMLAGQHTESLRQANSLIGCVSNFENILSDLSKRPFPQRLKKEEFSLFMKRVAAFFPEIFKTTSPSRMAKRIDDHIKRSYGAMTKAAWYGAESILHDIAGLSKETPLPEDLEPQMEKVRQDLFESCRDYLEALKTLKMYYDRLQAAYPPAQELIQRARVVTTANSFWRRTKSKFKPAGELLRFGTAIWKDADEREQLQIFDAEYVRFLEQIKRLSLQTQTTAEKLELLVAKYKLSLKKYLARKLSASLAQAQDRQRTQITYRLLAQKGIGFWLFRSWYKKRA